ncbi:MAG: hypothetical protein NC120_12320 [Ruminococcus sp.]|nr:hypothetical protein [Ruminococcus sp.]
MEEKTMVTENEVEVLEPVNEDEDTDITVYEDGDDSGSYTGIALLIGGLAVAGAVSIGRGIWKGIGKLRKKAAEKKDKTDPDVIDADFKECGDEDEPEADEDDKT